MWRVRSAKCLKLLLNNGFDVNGVADRRRSSTILHIAARYDLVDVIQTVIDMYTQTKTNTNDEIHGKFSSKLH